MRHLFSSKSTELVETLDRLHSVRDRPLNEIVEAIGLDPRSDLVGQDFRGVDFRFREIEYYNLSGCDLRGAIFDSNLPLPRGYDSAFLNSDEVTFGDKEIEQAKTIVMNYFYQPNGIGRLVSLLDWCERDLPGPIWGLAITKLQASKLVSKLERRTLKEMYGHADESMSILASGVIECICANLIRKKPPPYQRFRSAILLGRYRHIPQVKTALKDYWLHAKRDWVVRTLGYLLGKSPNHES